MQNYDDVDFNINFDDDFEVGQKYKKEHEKAQQIERNSRTNGIIILYFSIALCLILFVAVLYYNITTPRKMPTLEISQKELSERGSIYSKDGFSLASSKNLYKVSVIKKSIDPNKMDFFIRLFSIYSGIDEQYLREKLRGSGHITLSYKLSPKVALNLKQLNKKLLRAGVFRSYEYNGRIYPKAGLSIEISGEAREYLYKDLSEPILGYTNKIEGDGITKPKGVKGVERYYEYALSSKQDGHFKGNRDVGFNLILDKNAILKQRIDGKSVVLTIPLKLQKKIENIIDEGTKTISASEIIIGIMDSSSGAILSLASSNRFNPKRIKQSEYANLNPSFIEQSFEPGSIMKPVIYSILLEKNLIKPNEIFNLHNGVYKFGRYTIRDSHPQKYASAENIIVQSSNIGMVQMAQRLNAQSYHNALVAFGFSLPTEIDLPYEKTGIIPNAKTLNSHIYKGSVSYGYAMRATFMQMLRAYSAFANGGHLVNPYLMDYIIDTNNKIIDKNKSGEKIHILGKYSADALQKVLIKTVQKGTAKVANVEGVIIGGKTGTARIATNGRYGSEYIGSFFGFAKDKKANYTIGVVVFGAKDSSYYASQTAAPLAKKVIEALIDEGYLRQER
ncbi:peptidoglycan D,D-transpeptidase FtsI family protein [Helicobacter sp. 23-1045]